MIFKVKRTHTTEREIILRSFETSADEILLLVVKQEKDLKLSTMLHLHKASRSINNVLNYSRNHFRSTSRCVSSSVVNFNVSHPKHHHLNGLHSINLQKLRTTQLAPIFYSKHFFSTKGKGDEEVETIEIEPEVESPADFLHTHLPATVAIPEIWPYLPCVATSRNPVFPRFMKILEVSEKLYAIFMKSKKFSFLLVVL